MSRRRWITLAMVVGGAVIVALGIPAMVAASKPSVVSGYDGLVWYDSFDVGTEFVAGQISLMNESDSEMKVIEVKPIMDPEARLTFLGSYLAGDDKIAALSDRIVEFPPTKEDWGSFEPAQGGAIRPVGELFYYTSGTELMLAFRVEGGTRNEMRAVEVIYEVAGVRKKERIDTGIVVCVPEAVKCREKD